MVLIKVREIASAGGSGFGSLSSIFCPACVPLIGSFFSTIGLGGLVNFKLLSGLTILFLVLGLSGLYLNSRYHKKLYFLLVGGLGSVLAYSGRYLTESYPLMILGGFF